MTGKMQLVPGKMRRPKQFSADDIAIMRRMAEQGRSQPDIAKALNRSVGSIAGKLARLGWRTFGESGRAYADPPDDAAPGAPRVIERPIAPDPPIRCGEWPADAPLFEDDPRAPAWEPRWKAPPILPWSAVGSSAAMCVDGRAARAYGMRMR